MLDLARLISLSAKNPWYVASHNFITIDSDPMAEPNAKTQICKQLVVVFST
ncbi:MAG: hypothetical protein AAGE96_12860 [Cyanobacteria bacterium P01_G01_bin.19]